MDLSKAIMEVTLKELANYDVLQYLDKLQNASSSDTKETENTSK